MTDKVDFGHIGGVGVAQVAADSLRLSVAASFLLSKASRLRDERNGVEDAAGEV